jgi:hypothetical protein
MAERAALSVLSVEIPPSRGLAVAPGPCTGNRRHRSDRSARRIMIKVRWPPVDSTAAESYDLVVSRADSAMHKAEGRSRFHLART